MNIADTALQNYLDTCRRCAGRIVLLVLLAMGISVAITLMMEKEYKASSRVIVASELDPSTSIYASQRVAQAATSRLIDLAYTDTFYNRFTQGNERIENYFPDEREKRRRQFERDVIVRSSQDGFITVTTFNANEELALKENQAALAALQETAKQYFGEDNGVSISVANPPSLYDGVGRPNIWLNMAAGLVFGFTIALIHMAFVTRQRMRRARHMSPDVMPTRLKNSF